MPSPIKYNFLLGWEVILGTPFIFAVLERLELEKQQLAF